MEFKETSLRSEPYQTIIEDSEFFKYIFKKTEKISCAVFYILRSIPEIRHEDGVVSDVESAATNVLDVALMTLKGTLSHADTHAREIQHALIILESRLRVAQASRILREGYLEVFLHEIDSVQRSLRKYIDRGGANNPLFVDEVKVEPARERKTVTPKRLSEPNVEKTQTVSQGLSRRDRIMSVIKDRGEATIKDIASAVTDCSEKTIQRELISLIKDNVILRDGERRWSKYKLV